MAKRMADRFVPERQIILRSERGARAFVISQRAQLVAVGCVVALAMWSVYATANYVFYGTVVAAKDKEIGEVRLANASLREEMQRSQERFNIVTSRLEAKHAYLVGLMERTGGKAPAKAPAAKAAPGAKNRATPDDGLTSSREAVKRQLSELDESLRTAPAGKAAESGIENTLRDRGRILAENGRLQARLNAIEERLGELHVAQQGVMTQLARRALSNLDEVRDMIAGLGLDATRILGRGNAAPKPQSNVGGPFVPASAGDTPASQLGIGAADRAVERWEGVQRALRSLPLGAPVQQVQVMSGFGRRVDPFNGMMAFHSGLDIAGTMGTPIHATAPGRVTFVGTNGAYGRMVEIDHGQGLSTRYAHLSRFIVHQGERVHYGQTIGLMGSTGRSTGVHVHYEVLVDGKPRDPTKFIQAGSYVFVQR
jgi:murein DD-endopeptidase MepM/ murein hydrolase activator NlpD